MVVKGDPVALLRGNWSLGARRFAVEVWRWQRLNQSRFAIAKLLHNRRECFRAPKRLANFISGSGGRRETSTRNSVTPRRRRLWRRCRIILVQHRTKTAS